MARCWPSKHKYTVCVVLGPRPSVPLHNHRQFRDSVRDGKYGALSNRRGRETTPALRVTLLLNIQRKQGDTTSPEQLVRRFADHLWKTDWPGSSRPSVFYDPRALHAEGPGGVLHAKAVVADDEVAFITSANLTEAALDRNIELGVLIRDRAFALAIGGYFRSLIERDLLKPLPLA